MRISILEINNFRGVKSARVRFSNHSVLIGPNNSGKTTVIEALALVLGRDGLVRGLTEHDFFGSTPTAADRIAITATVTGFASDDFTEHPEWFNDRRGVPCWLETATGRVLAQPAEGGELACQITFAARFDLDTLEVETRRFFTDADGLDVFDDENYVAVPSRLIRDIGFFLIPASRSWDRMLSFSSELFRRVIRSTDGLPAETILDLRDRLRTRDASLDQDARLKPVIDAVNEEMILVLGSATPLRLRLTATDGAGVLDAVTPHFQTGERVPIPARRQGSGLVSLQSLFLLLHFGQKRVVDGESFFMALEEPELHLPPAVQRRVLARLQALSTQTIVSTHSPLVAAYCDATSLMIVRNDEGALSATPTLAEPLGADTSNAVRRLFQINRVETVAAMMHESVLVPEGRIDFEWFALLQRVAEMHAAPERPCLFGVRVGVVPTSDVKVKETCEVLAKAHPAVFAFVDGDRAGRSYAAAINMAGTRTKAIIRWPDGWTIEDAIGLLVKADETAILAELAADPAIGTITVPTLVARLKSQDRAAGGMKGNMLAYEAIADALSHSVGGRERAGEMLHAIAALCAGGPTDRFAPEPQNARPIATMVFVPWP